VITNVEKMDGGWWKGRLRGQTGMFPDNFVKVLPGTPAAALKGDEGMGRRRCRVLFSYNPTHDDELELQVDDWVDFLCEVEDGWFKGRNKGRVGVFPSNFVETIEADNHAATVHEKNKKNSLQGSHVSNGTSVLSNATNKMNPATDNKIHDNRIPDNKISEPIKSKDSSMIHETPKKETSANNSSGKKSMTTSERMLLRNSGPAPDTAPRLPPKPVKEQCLVLFPYTGQNEDELSLVEGQTINIISRDIEDKGWWKGELDGLVGVFPDNFVKLLPQDHEEVSDKKPHRPPTSTEHLNVSTGSSSKLNRSNSSLKERGAHESLKSGSSEKLTKKVNDLLRNSHSNIITAVEKKFEKKPYGKSESDTHLLASNKGSKTESDGNRYLAYSGRKSPAPARPAEPPTPAVNLADKFGMLAEEQDREDVIEVVKTPTEKGSLLDTVNRESTLTNVTAKRVKAPKRRPPSSIFLKDNIPDLVEIGVDSEDDNIVATKNEDSPEKVESANKSMLETTPNPGVHLRDKGKIGGLPVFPPKEGGKEEAQKPSWLEELSRKQANRKSGIFSDEKKPDLPSPENKPIIPSKPSDNRKSLGSFSRRPSSFADKSNKSETDAKPVRPPFPGAAAAALTKSSSSSQLPDHNNHTPTTINNNIINKEKSRTRKISDSAKKCEHVGSNEKLGEKDLSRKASESSSRLSDVSAARKSSSKPGDGGSGRKHSPGDGGSGRKHSDLSRKSSDSGKTTESPAPKPSVHSTNLGKPEGRSFASVPERPADLRPTDLSRQGPSDLRPTDLSRQGPSDLRSTDLNRTSDKSPFSRRSAADEPSEGSRPLRPEGETAAIGWAPHVLKPDANKQTNKSIEAQLTELRSELLSQGSQVSSLRHQLEQEREKRIDLEAEVQSLRRLVMSRKE